MQYYHVILFLLAIAIAASAAAPKLKIPYPVLLIVAGIGIGFIPHFNYVPVTPELVFLIFLPPLLYDASLNISFPVFRANIGTISMLAITMVFITMTAIAVISYYIIPGITWPIAFVIGAVLSPPDAAAATGVLKDMKLPDRTRTILEGESLVNDASALTAYRIGLGVVMGGAFHIWEAGLQFVVVLAGGAAVGIVMAYLFSWFLKITRLENTAGVSLSIILPFVAYQLAETFSVSGVISVVVMGLMISKRMHNGQLFSTATIDQSRSVWSVIIYVLSGLIFILIGLEFPQVLDNIPLSSVGPLLWSSLFIFIIALVIRILFVFEYKYRHEKLHIFGEDCDPESTEMHGKHCREKELDWRNALVIGWSGMRGIVSVATAIGLPFTLADGAAFPQRNAIIFVTVVVVLMMLIVQGIGLPFLIRILKIGPTEKSEI